MSRRNHNGPANFEHFTAGLETFAEEYGIDVKIFGEDGIHYRLTGICATLDCWPTTGRYWIKDIPLGFKEYRKGILPDNYDDLDKFLRSLFSV